MDTMVQEGAVARRHVPHYLETLPRTLVIMADASAEILDDGQATIQGPGVLGWIRNIAGEEWGHVAVMGFDGVAKASFPRGRKWRDYPFVDDVRLTPIIGEHDANTAWVLIDGNDGPRLAYKVGIDRAIASAERIVVTLADDEKVEFDELREGKILARLKRYIDMMSAGQPDRERQVFIVRAGRPSEAMDYRAFETLTERYMPYGRFGYSYAMNADVILGAVLRHVHAKVGDMPRDWGQDGRPQTDIAHHARKLATKGLMGLKDVLALQVLFRLERLGGIPDAWDRDNAFEWDLVCIALAGGGETWRGDLLWRGTGKHDPVPISRDRMVDAVSALLELGLASSRRKALQVSVAGAMFLDMMHQDNEDPDVLLRWRGPATEKDRASMDDWIIRHFRKIKNKFRQACPEEDASAD